MKSIKYLFLVIALLVITFGVAEAQMWQVTVSSVVSSFNATVSTTGTVGLLVPNTVNKIRIANISITWDTTSSTSTLRLYDNLKGTGSKIIYEVNIPSGTIAPNYIQEGYAIILPKMAVSGLTAVLDNSGHKVSVNLVYY